MAFPCETDFKIVDFGLAYGAGTGDTEEDARKAAIDAAHDDGLREGKKIGDAHKCEPPCRSMWQVQFGEIEDVDKSPLHTKILPSHTERADRYGAAVKIHYQVETACGPPPGGGMPGLPGPRKE
jgi:hypothetical protein